jgi:large subunit ribosomal protein L25
VECLPADLVDSFEVDVSALEIGQSLQVSDLDLGARYKLMVDETAIVAAVSGPRAEEEDEEEEADTDEPEVIGEKKEVEE